MTVSWQRDLLENLDVINLEDMASYPRILSSAALTVAGDLTVHPRDVLLILIITY